MAPSSARRTMSLIEEHESRKAAASEQDEHVPVVTFGSGIDEAGLDAVLEECALADDHDAEQVPGDDEDVEDAGPEAVEDDARVVTVELNATAASSRSSTPALSEEDAARAKWFRQMAPLAHRFSLACLMRRVRQRSRFVCNNVELRARLFSIALDAGMTPTKAVDLAFVKKATKWYRQTLARVDPAAGDLRASCRCPSTCLANQINALFEKRRPRSSIACSNDTAVMVFVALMRSLGIRSRLIAALNPLPPQPSKLIARWEAARDAKPPEACACQGGTSNQKAGRAKDDSDDDVIHVEACGTKKRRRSASRGSEYFAEGSPTSWAEVFVPKESRWVPVNLADGQVDNRRGIEETVIGVPMTYVVGVDADGGVVDVVRRYASSWAGVLKRLHNRKWWDSVVPSHVDDAEETELKAFADDDKMPDRLNDFRNHPKYAMEKFLKKFEVIHPLEPVLAVVRGHNVYPRANLHTLHTAENWMREPMRRVRDNEMPFKRVKSRSRRVDADELQSLYGEWQTDPWTPEPVRNGIVPTSAYGHCELWTPDHLPAGAVHLAYPRIAMAARKVGAHYAPAMMGFEAHCRGSVPVINGIVVAKEFSDSVMAAWHEMEQRRAENAERRRVEGICRLWRALVLGVISRHSILVEKHADPDAGTRQRKRAKVQFTAAKHVHEFLDENRTFDPDQQVWAARCACGFTQYEEDL
ncbi:Rad4 beta-hairpin domain-containing protein [Plasmodiophora brassicae]|nr:hypothetical protein PBRA_004580 [Plasmodiophora brassicae]